MKQKSVTAHQNPEAPHCADFITLNPPNPHTNIPRIERLRMARKQWRNTSQKKKNAPNIPSQTSTQVRKNPQTHSDNYPKAHLSEMKGTRLALKISCLAVRPIGVSHPCQRVVWIRGYAVFAIGTRISTWVGRGGHASLS